MPFLYKSSSFVLAHPTHQSLVCISAVIFGGWVVTLFFGIIRFAQSDLVFLAALGFGVISIGFAIFLILELNAP